MPYIPYGYSVIMFLSFCNYTIAMISLFNDTVVFCCHCLSLSQESCFGTVENSEHTKEIYITYKRYE